MTATQQTVDGRPALRFERRLDHSVERVWRAVTEPAELARWFVAEVPWTPRDGEEFEAGERPAASPRSSRRALLAWTWADERYSFELAPEGDGCVLVFTHVFNPELGPGWQHAAGWDTYLDAARRAPRRRLPLRGGRPRGHRRADRALPRALRRRDLEQPGQRRARVLGDVEQRLGVDPQRDRDDRAHDGDDDDLELLGAAQPLLDARLVVGLLGAAARSPARAAPARATRSGAASQTAATTRR